MACSSNQPIPQTAKCIIAGYCYILDRCPAFRALSDYLKKRKFRPFYCSMVGGGDINNQSNYIDSTSCLRYLTSHNKQCYNCQSPVLKLLEESAGKRLLPPVFNRPVSHSGSITAVQSLTTAVFSSSESRKNKSTPLKELIGIINQLKPGEIKSLADLFPIPYDNYVRILNSYNIQTIEGLLGYGKWQLRSIIGATLTCAIFRALSKITT